MKEKIKKIKDLRINRGVYSQFSQYIAETIDKSISFSDYLSNNYLDSRIDYSEYLSEKINL